MHDSELCQATSTMRNIRLGLHAVSKGLESNDRLSIRAIQGLAGEATHLLNFLHSLDPSSHPGFPISPDWISEIARLADH